SLRPAGVSARRSRPAARRATAASDPANRGKITMRDIPPGLITVPLRRLALAAAIATVTFDGVSAQSPPTFVPAGASLGESTSYRLNPGDVLEISVRGFSELRQRGVIELDGEVSLPLAGRIAVADKTIAEAQAQIVRLATAKPVRQKTADG